MGPGGQDDSSAGIYALLTLGGLMALVGTGALSWRWRTRRS